MTTLTITPDVAKKRLKLDGVIAAGEKVDVAVVGFGDKSTETTRLRVMCCDKLITQFPMPPKDGEEQEKWEVSDGNLVAVLNLNTVQAEKMTRCGGCPCLFILDDASDEVRQLYGAKEHNVGQWIKNRGTDVPANLDEWPHLLDEVWSAINGFKMQIEGEWSEYRNELSAAWSGYQANLNSLYQQFTQNVSALIDNKATKTEFYAHVNNKSNPHEVRIAQIPQLRSELDNLGSRITNESTARENADNAIRERVINETSRAVTKENQLGNAIAAENRRAVAAEENLDYAIRQVYVRIDSAVKVLSGRTFNLPLNDRERNNLIAYIIRELGGNIADSGIVPGPAPQRINLVATDGTNRSIKVVKNSVNEYTTEVV